MLNEFFKDHITKPVNWGPISGTFWSTVVYWLPQILLIPLAPMLLGLMDGLSRNTKLLSLQVVAEGLMIALVLLVVFYVYKQKPKELGLGKLTLTHLGYVFVGFGAYFILSTVINKLSEILFTYDVHQEQQLGISALAGVDFVMAFVALVIFAPLAEEIIFRGLLFLGFRKRFPFWLSAVVTGVIFAVMHGQVNVGLDVFALSLVLCYLRESTGSLWPAIGVHMVKNGLAYYILFINPDLLT